MEYPVEIGLGASCTGNTRGSRRGSVASVSRHIPRRETVGQAGGDDPAKSLASRGKLALD